MNRRLRCALFVILFGMLPLLTANVMGVRFGGGSHLHVFSYVRDRGGLRQIDWGIDRPSDWWHGWPCMLIWRRGESGPSPGRWPKWHFSKEPDVSLLPLPSSRWPFDDAEKSSPWQTRYLLKNPLLWNLGVSIVLLFGTCLAATRSRFVEFGKVQLRMQTLVVGITAIAIFLGASINGLVAWERALLLPTFILATLGYASTIRCSNALGWYWRHSASVHPSE